MKIVLARSALLRYVFPLAQEGMPFLFRIHCEHNHDCNQCYGKKYFHAPRIARVGKFVLCRQLTNALQKCKCLPVRSQYAPCREYLRVAHSIFQRQ
jgi:hypothetical protein